MTTMRIKEKIEVPTDVHSLIKFLSLTKNMTTWNGFFQSVKRRRGNVCLFNTMIGDAITAVIADGEGLQMTIKSKFKKPKRLETARIVITPLNPQKQLVSLCLNLPEGLTTERVTALTTQLKENLERLKECVRRVP